MAEGVSVPMFKERGWVVVHEAVKPSYCVGGAVHTVAVVPAGHLALMFSALHVRRDAHNGFMGVTVAETADTVVGTVPRLVIWGDLEAFVTECWLAKRGLLVRVEEGGILDVVRRTLCTSYCWDATTDWGFRRRLSIDLAEDPCREACVNKVPLGVIVLFTSPF